MVEDKRNKLVSNPFSYKITKAGKVMVYRGQKLVKIIGKKSSGDFLRLEKTADEAELQMALAKLTGFYKH